MSLLSPSLGSNNPTKQRWLVTLVQLGSLAATGWMVWSAALFPRSQRQSLAGLLWEVTGYTVLAWAWSAAVAFGLYAMLPVEDRSAMKPRILRTAATAVWFGPAMILLSEFSPAALLAALVLIVYASRLLCAEWRPVLSAVAPSDPVPEPEVFRDSQIGRKFLWRDRLPSLSMALCLEAGAVAIAMHYPLLGAAWLCFGTALLTVFSIMSGAADAGRPPSLPKSIVGIVATILLSVMLALGSGARFGSGGQNTAGSPPSPGFGRGAGDNPGFLASARTVLRQIFYGETPGPPGTGGASGPRQAEQRVDTGADGGFPGIILWPDIKKVTTLVAPLPELNAYAEGRPARPLGIPFSGEYWLFRWPFSKPPATSPSQRGTPIKMGFSSTDHRPLQMEAHQKLETPVAVRCCRAIQLEVLNADRFPGTVWLEMTLVYQGSGRPQILWLDKVPVRSRPDTGRNPIDPVRETLEFAIPSAPALDQFNEFKIVFMRAAKRMDKSAGVSIERFVLLPK